jgi:hypothetical protein
LESVEYESVRVARLYRQIGRNVNFTPSGEHAPYEYKLLDDSLGVLLFNPAGYNHFERRRGGRVPLQARVDYDVYDWRIVRDEFRVPDYILPATHRLALGNLKVNQAPGPDGRTSGGIVLETGPSGDPTQHALTSHFLLIDVETGARVFEKAADGRVLVRVDKSVGNVTISDLDNDDSNGLQGRLYFPDSTTATVNLGGRTLRALYMANDEWSVQAMKAAALYRTTYARPAAAQYYVGGSAAAFFGSSLPNENAAVSRTRIYFPVIDTGRKVSVGEILYRDTANNLQIIESQDFVITASPADPLGLPYIDIREVAPDAASFDYATYGYAVRNVRGASLVVRVLWNPNRFTLGSDQAQNLRRLDEWGRGWRRTVTETYLQRGDNIR